MNEKEVEALLRETKAILEGHFLLTSGLHSSLYVEKFNVLQHPKYTRELCNEFAKYFKSSSEFHFSVFTLGEYCTNSQ